MQRLQTRAQFQAVLAGRTVARTAHFALHCVALPAPAADRDKTTIAAKPLFDVVDVWVGAMTPKRSAKRAVTRNAIKRQIYNVSTDLNFQAPPMAYVVRLSAGFDKAHFTSASSSVLKAAVREELYQLFAKTGALPTGTGAA